MSRGLQEVHGVGERWMVYWCIEVLEYWLNWVVGVCGGAMVAMVAEGEEGQQRSN